MKRSLKISLITVLLSAIGCLTPCARAQALPGYTKLNAAALTATTYTDTTCADTTTCFYYVTAVNTFGESSPSAIITAVIPVTGTHTVSLSWTSTVGSYNIYRGATPLPPSAFTATVN
jgi:hypothetical protein